MQTTTVEQSRHWVIVLSLMIFASCGVSRQAQANGMNTSSQFAVSEGGAATVSVLIQVPRGIGGMEPQLSLNYSSGSGNGLLGLGWVLTGPSAITRCAKSMDIDGQRGSVNFSVGDRYCLDGQRLDIEGADRSDSAYGSPNTEYRTIMDSFARITALGRFSALTENTPLSFKVENKSGLIQQYGISENSQVLTNFAIGLGMFQSLSRWNLQRISDRNGNSIEFVYCGGEVSPDGTGCSTAAWSGSKVLHYIRYTDRGTVNGTFAVVFRYEARPDKVGGYHAGSYARQTQRLTKVETYRDFASSNTGTLMLGTLIRSYDLVYEATEMAGSSIRATKETLINSARILHT